ncbi:MAG: hypothetical protein HOF07_02005 [Elusimicrobiaceae bacterium]|nr:hypothetical protein [Elusimicrobiaceae bacterium]
MNKVTKLILATTIVCLLTPIAKAELFSAETTMLVNTKIEQSYENYNKKLTAKIILEELLEKENCTDKMKNHIRANFSKLQTLIDSKTNNKYVLFTDSLDWLQSWDNENGKQDHRITWLNMFNLISEGLFSFTNEEIIEKFSYNKKTNTGFVESIEKNKENNIIKISLYSKDIPDAQIIITINTTENIIQVSYRDYTRA